MLSVQELARLAVFKSLRLAQEKPECALSIVIKQSGENSRAAMIARVDRPMQAAAELVSEQRVAISNERSIT